MHNINTDSPHSAQINNTVAEQSPTKSVGVAKPTTLSGLHESVFMIAVLSADGYISQQKDQLVSWTSKEDKKRYVALTKEAGVMVMGSTTFKTFSKPLPNRTHVVYTRSPDSFVNPFPDAPEKIYATNMDPVELIKKLKDEGYSKIAICGGQEIYSLFMQSGVVTHLFLTFEPVVLGGGISLLSNIKNNNALSQNNTSEQEGLPAIQKLNVLNTEITASGSIFVDYKIN